MRYIDRQVILNLEIKDPYVLCSSKEEGKAMDWNTIL